MHHIDADKVYLEKAREELHKNTTSYIEQILEATSQKTATLRPPSSHHSPPPKKRRRTRHAGQYWRSKDELKSDSLQ